MGVPGIPIIENMYPVTMDFYPQESADFNRVYKFYDNLKLGKLTTTKCNKCGHVAMPPRVICPECNSDDLSWIDLPTKGKVLQFSEEVAGVPLGFDAPLIHAFIDLGNGMRFLTRMVNCAQGQLKEGDEVQLFVYNVPPSYIDVKGGVKEMPRVFFAFEPVKKK